MKREETSKKRYIAVLSAMVALILAVAIASPTLAYYIRSAGKAKGDYTPAPLPDPPTFENVEGVIEDLSFVLSQEDDEKSSLFFRVKDEGYPVYVRAAIIATWQRKAPCECEACKTVEPDGCDECKQDEGVCTELEDCNKCTEDCEKCKVYPKCENCLDDCINCADCGDCADDCLRCQFSSDDCEKCKYCKDNCMPKEEENTPSTQADDDTEGGSEGNTESGSEGNTEGTEPPYCARCNGEVDIHFNTPVGGTDYKIDVNGVSWVKSGDYWYHKQPLIHEEDNDGVMETDTFIKSCKLLIEYIEPSEDDNDTEGDKLPKDSTWPGNGWYLNVEILVQTIQAIGFTDGIPALPAWYDAWGGRRDPVTGEPIYPGQ